MQQSATTSTAPITTSGHGIGPETGVAAMPAGVVAVSLLVDAVVVPLVVRLLVPSPPLPAPDVVAAGTAVVAVGCGIIFGVGAALGATVGLREARDPT